MGRRAISIFIQAAVSKLCYLMANPPKLTYTLNESVHGEETENITILSECWCKKLEVARVNDCSMFGYLVT